MAHFFKNKTSTGLCPGSLSIHDKSFSVDLDTIKSNCIGLLRMQSR